MRRIGIYGGTFDPIHHGHLILAQATREQLGLDQVIFVPAAASPFKKEPRASAATRLAMLQAATKSEATFAIDDRELRRPPPSYTIDTVQMVKDKWPDAHLFFLIGDGNLAGLPSWRGFEDLRHMVTFIVLQRSITPVAHEYLSVDRRIDISATEIRQRIAAGGTIHFLVPPAVEQIISARGLYREVAK